MSMLENKNGALPRMLAREALWHRFDGCFCLVWILNTLYVIMKYKLHKLKEKKKNIRGVKCYMFLGLRMHNSLSIQKYCHRELFLKSHQISDSDTLAHVSVRLPALVSFFFQLHYHFLVTTQKLRKNSTANLQHVLIYASDF